jgi:anti-sigma factor RsiW
MTWTCEQTEGRLSDYLEGGLNAEERVAFDAHVNACPRCTPLVANVAHLLSSMRAMEPVEVPPRLVYGILDKTLGPREVVSGWRVMLGWLQGMASMRFAYGALSVVATLVIFVTASGFNWRKPKLADLAPSVIYRNADKQVHLVYGRGMKFVNDMRVVNEIQSRLRQDSEIPAVQENVAPQSAPEKQPGHTDGTKPASPRQQNRANDITRQVEILAEEVPLLGGPWMGGQMGARKMP